MNDQSPETDTIDCAADPVSNWVAQTDPVPHHPLTLPLVSPNPTPTYPNFFPFLLFSQPQTFVLPPTPPTPLDLPISFVAGLRSQLIANQTLLGMVPGGLWYRQIPPGQPNPAVVYTTITIDRTDTNNANTYFETGQFQISVYAYDPATATKIADLIGGLVSYPQNNPIVSPPPAPLVWMGGKLLYMRPTNPIPPQPPKQGPRGLLVWSEIRSYNYQYFGSYN